jgi:hypothetical protein
LSHVPSPFYSDYFGDGGCDFCPGQPGPGSSYLRFPTIAGMTGVHHHTQLLSVEMCSHELFSWAGLEQRCFPVSVFQVAWDDRYALLHQAVC